MDDLLRALIAALEQGLEVTVTLRKPKQQADTTPGNHAMNTVKCAHCGWKHSYSRSSNAQRGYRAHLKSCPKKNSSSFEPPQWLKDQTEGKEL